MANTDEAAKSAGVSPVTVAIVFVDIVGSMRLIADIGDLAFANLFQHYHERIGYAAKAHNGIVIKRIGGDAILLIFRNVADAIPFVSELRNSLLQDPSDDIRNLQLRISLHIGAIIMQTRSYGEDIFGSSVNIAARLSTLALPDQLVVSHTSINYLPPDQRSLVRQTEHSDLKGFDGKVEFGRINLSECRVT